MKKFLIVIVSLFVISTICIYIFIPATVNISRAVSINCTQDGAYRFLSQQDNWLKWWPSANADSGKTDTGNILSYKDYEYKIIPTASDVTAIQVSNAEQQVISSINIQPLLIDSVTVLWQFSLSTDINPVKRLQQYVYARQMENNMGDILASFRIFMSSKKNVYGSDIEQIKVTDTLLVATKKIFTVYPGTTEIYALINSLKTYITTSGAQQTHYPMMHIRTTDSNKYEAMVAIPVNTEIKTRDGIFIKRMAPGKILVTDSIPGGDYSVKQAFKQLENYVSDYKKISPAIPFESLETDRSSEPDTLKWVTRIYYPVF